MRTLDPGFDLLNIGLVTHTSLRSFPDDTCPLRVLWLNVLLQQLRDAFNTGNKSLDGTHKDLARQWLQAGGKDFKMVCDYAGLNPDQVHKSILHLLNTPEGEKLLKLYLPKTSQNGHSIQRRGPRPKKFRET